MNPNLSHPHTALPSIQIISIELQAFTISLWNALQNTAICPENPSSSIPLSIRHKVGSDGTPLFSNPNDWSFLRLCLPNSIISARPTHLDILANIVSMTMSPSLWRMLPLSVLRKSGMEKAKSINFSKCFLWRWWYGFFFVLLLTC